jgi:glycine cleavage system H protein
VYVANIPAELLYTADHEYVKDSDDPDVVIVGITDFAQEQLGDVVFVDLPKVGASFGLHQVFGTIEAVKTTSDLYCPLSGQITEINERLDKEPALVNSDPYGAGWMIKLRVNDSSERAKLLTSDAYAGYAQ